MNTLSNILEPAGRVGLSAIFIASGMAKLTSFAGMVGYVAASGVPFPELALAGATAVEILGGLALLLGFQARIAAAALAGFSVLAGILFHAFWADTDPQAVMVNQIMFWKNIAIAGGMLFVVRHGAGSWSIDALIARRAATA